MSKYELKFQIPKSDIIQPYDHVHHAKLLEYLETARVEYLSSVGLSYESMLNDGIFLVIFEIKISYKREVKGTEITLCCDRQIVDGKRILLSQSILNERGKLAVEAEIELRCLKQGEKRACPPPDEFVERFAGR